MEFISLLFFFVVVIPSAIIHEYAHGWMADQLGDPTAKYAGRLSLDPRVHIDKFGTIILPLIFLFLSLIGMGGFIFAYAKPVPFNPYNLKNQKWGPALVAAAGPLSNLVLAFVFGLTLQIFMKLGIGGSSFLGLIYIVVNINVLLAIFNLVPIPPLDGSKLLYALLPDSQYKLKMMLEKYGMIILLVFVFYFFSLLSPVINYFTRFFVSWLF
jgi:Zn-dependent protease